MQGSLAAIGHWVDGMDSDVEEKEVEKDGRKVENVDKDRVDGRRSTNGRKKVGESSSESENDLQTRERRVYGIKKKEQIFGSKSVERGRGDNIDVPIKILFKDAIMQMVRYFFINFFLLDFSFFVSFPCHFDLSFMLR